VQKSKSSTGASVTAQAMQVAASIIDASVDTISDKAEESVRKVGW
jgi:hypothetical protein